MKISERIGVAALIIAALLIYIGIEWVTRPAPDPCAVEVGATDSNGEELRSCDSPEDAGVNGVTSSRHAKVKQP